MEQVIDSHSYYGQIAVPQADGSTFRFSAPLHLHREQQTAARNAGYDLRFVIQPAHLSYNSSLAETVARNNDVFAGGILQINPNRKLAPVLGYNSPQELSDILCAADKHHPGTILGMKFNTAFTRWPVTDPLSRRYLDVADQHHVAVMIHCPSQSSEQKYSSPEMVAQLAADYPETSFIACHLGGLHPDFAHEMAELAQMHPNIYLNTTGTGRLRRHVRDGITVAEDAYDWQNVVHDITARLPGRVLFGTDFPWNPWDIYPVSTLPKEAREAVLSDNYVRAFDPLEIASKDASLLRTVFRQISSTLDSTPLPFPSILT
ncbi:MAG: amidohydrolase family protein [Nanoarchaeota archaeon]